MAGVRLLTSALLLAGALAAGPAAEAAEEIPMALASDDSCAAEGCGLELLQLRGEQLTASLEKDAETCGAWLAKHECDTKSEVAVADATTCEDDCSQDTCCESKASCDFWTPTGGCANLAVPANVTKMVWAIKEAKADDLDMFCAATALNEESCGKSCCELKPCKKCSGEEYTTGCKAGSIGTCSACPASSSCPAGQFQTCGDGVLSECQPCSNAPAKGEYSAASMSSECPWECSTYYEKKGGQCLPASCKAWDGKCDATSQVPLALTTSCDGHCSDKVCCAAKSTCSSYYGNSSLSISASSGTCARVEDAAADGKVWAPTEAAAEETLYCKGADSDKTSCQKACCSQQSCTTCSGQLYTDGCEAGSTGTCTVCPTSSECPKGQYQTCGEGVLSKCQTCSNAPKGASYTDSVMSIECPWECDAGYIHEGASCKASCSLYTCSKEKLLAPIPTAASVQGDTTEVCCQDAGCTTLAEKSALPDDALTKGGCNTVTSESECSVKYVVSGNVHGTGKGATIYTACTWDPSQKMCNWDYHQYRNCVF